jgi:dihydropteroate synthase
MKLGSFDWNEKNVLVMGVLNVTPDSFSDGGKFVDVEKAVQHAQFMIQQGADIIDVGGESSRPGSDPVSEEEELQRVLPVVQRLVQESKVQEGNTLFSIDTYKPKVAEACLQAGVHIVNDINGLRNPEMIEVVAEHNTQHKQSPVPVIIMHMLGNPKTMQVQENITYDDVVEDIKMFFKERIQAAKAAGIQDIILDPGIGFGKTVEHNLQILKRLGEFRELGCPLLMGSSRKSFIGKLTGAEVDDRLPGSIASMTVAVLNGASIVRVHDVQETKQAVQVVQAIRDAKLKREK